MEFKDRLKYLREQKGWTKKETAQKIGVTTGAYSNWEYGNREPNFETVKKIASALGVTAYYLQTGYEDSYSENIETTREGIMQNQENIINFAKSYDEFSDFNDLYYVSQIINCIKAKNRKIDSLETSLLEAQHKLNELN